VTDSALGIRSACARCHTDRTESALDAQVTAWYGALKPRDPAVDAVLAGAGAAGAARQLLLPEAPHVAAVYAGLARFVDHHLTLDIPIDREAGDRLERLAAHTDVDVRALALAALHFAQGEEPATRRFLAARLEAETAGDLPLRARWATALGHLADAQRARGNPGAGVLVYRRAREIDPSNARVHLNLGITLAEDGQHSEAVASYRESLRLEPRQPLALVNLGIALAARGDRAGAEAAYRRALAFNPREPLAHFNLANLHLSAGAEDSAMAGYRRSIAADPSLALPRFVLARIHARRGELTTALQEVEAGLEFDPSNSEARTARAQLIRALGAQR
jgi:Tfp pilus assembly protein PilF